MPYTPVPTDPKQNPVRINLLSDTQTRPTPAMREAMARAEVGDEQIGDDPTVNLLCERTADLLGKEAAVFMPSGTMCNVAATLAHCRPGDEILAERTAHLAMDEVITIEDRLSAGFHDGMWRAGAFAARTRTTANTTSELTGGGSAGLDLSLPEKLQLALDVEVARSYYARLDADPEPRPELAGTGTVRLTRHFTVNPTAH